jgi:hypothetical protein
VKFLVIWSMVVVFALGICVGFYGWRNQHPIDHYCPPNPKECG